MRALAIVVIAIVLVAIAAVALAPASLIAPTLARVTSSRVVLADVEGTLWDGRATIVGDDGARVPFAWSAERIALARGQLRVHLSGVDGATLPRGDIEVGDGSVRASGVSVVVPASWLVATISTLPISVTGDVAIDADTLDWSAASIRGGARAEWRNARLGAAGVPGIDLGTVVGTLTANGERFSGPIANDGGDVAIGGDIATSANGGGEANILLTPRRADDALARMLAALGTPEGGGYRVRARWHGR